MPFSTVTIFLKQVDNLNVVAPICRESINKCMKKKMYSTIAVMDRLRAPFNTPLKHLDKFVIIASYCHPLSWPSAQSSFGIVSSSMRVSSLYLLMTSIVMSNLRIWLALSALIIIFFNCLFLNHLLKLLANMWIVFIGLVNDEFNINFILFFTDIKGRSI